MYLRYTYNTATAKQLLDDLKTIFTSTATPNLSTLPSCLVANSVVTTAYDQAGWTLFDTPDANSYVLQSPVYDNATKFKYLYLSVATAGYLYMCVFDGWDNVAHTGTYPTVVNGATGTPTDTNSPPIVLNQNAQLYISVNPRRIIMYSLIGTGWVGPYGIAERSRVGAWDTATNAYCNSVHFGGTGLTGSYPGMSITSPYSVNVAATGLPFAAPQKHNITSIWGFASPPSNTGYYFCNGIGYIQTADGVSGADLGWVPPAGISSANASKNPSYALTRLNIASIYSYANEGGSLSDVSGIFLLPRNTGNPEDTVLADGTTYILMGTSYGRFALPNG